MNFNYCFKTCLKFLVYSITTLCLVAIVGCNKNRSDLKKAEEHSNSAEFEKAINILDKIILRNEPGYYTLKAAREAARIAYFDMKEFARAIKFYDHLIVYSKDPEERLFARKQIADIYFNTLNYKKAIEEINKFINEEKDLKVISEFKLKLAKSYYHEKDFYQANSEIESLLKGPIADEEKFKANLVKSDILVAEKKYSEAISVLTSILDKYPEKSLEEKVPITLSLVYEDNNDFKSAILIMEKYSEKLVDKDYAEIRLNRLKQRQKNAPGARGLNRKK